MREAEKLGLGGVFERPGALLPEVVRAVHCWRFCDGWAPSVLPLYDAVHGIDDWEALLLLLELIRNELNRTR